MRSRTFSIFCNISEILVTGKNYGLVVDNAVGTFDNKKRAPCPEFPIIGIALNWTSGVASSGGGGTAERITAIRSLSLTVTSETVIAFDPAQTVGANGLTINVGGNLECVTSGYYQGSIKFYINESSDPTHYAWVEIKPFATGVWELSPASLFKFKISNDAGMIVPLNGGLNLLAGDEVRFKGRATSGSSTLQTQTDTAPALGTTTQFAAMLNMWKVGEVTP